MDRIARIANNDITAKCEKTRKGQIRSVSGRIYDDIVQSIIVSARSTNA